MQMPQHIEAKMAWREFSSIWPSFLIFTFPIICDPLEKDRHTRLGFEVDRVNARMDFGAAAEGVLFYRRITVGNDVTNGFKPRNSRAS
jgi:hypothetical protein